MFVRAELEQALEWLIAQVPVLRQIADEQLMLRPGDVTPQESRRRLSVANRINVARQMLELDLLHGDAAWGDVLAEIRTLAELVLRENPTLQVRGPLSVVRASDVPKRHVLNRERRREVRRGYGLHRGVRNEEGPSLVVAFTPQAYEQLWHAHTIDEYTLVLDSRYVARYMDGEARVLEAGDASLFHFAPHTYHAIANKSSRVGRTLTLKYPLGISVWLPGLNLVGTERGSATVRYLTVSRRRKSPLIRRLQVRDPHHSYAINIAVLGPREHLTLRCDEPRFFYVLDGAVRVCAGGREVVAAADDMIVVDPTRSFRICASTQGGRVYWVSDLGFQAEQVA